MTAKPLNQLSGMPQMNAAFMGWQTTITIVKVVQEIVDRLVTNKKIPYTFEGTVQPLQAKELMIKPEGQRAWEWLQIHCITGALNLNNGDNIEYDGQPFKVMKLKDYKLNNYIEYHVVRDYGQIGNCP